MAERSVVVRIRAEIGDFRRQMQQASQAATGLGRAGQASGQQMSTAMTQTQAGAAAARAALRDAGQAAQETARGFGLSYNAAGQLTDQFGAMVTEAHAAELGLETASDATREFAAQQANAAAAANQATTNMGRLAASARDHEEAWSTAGGALLGFGAAVTAGVGLAIAKYAEFDKAMSEVSAATHASAADMGLLREAAVVAGADTSYSAKEAADAITELSKAGVGTADILSGGLTGALNLAAAGGMEVADAAELAATAMTQFKLSGDKLPHVADLLAAGAGKAQGSVADMGMALKQGGLVAAATGLTIEETTGTLAAFASAGLIGSDAGTSFKTMLQALTPNSEAASKEMKRLGISAYDANGEFIGMTAFAGKLKSSLGTLSDEQRMASEKIIFGSDAVRAANVLYEQGADGIAAWTDKVNVAGFAASTAAIKQDNLAGDLEKLGGSFDTVLIKGGGGAAQALRGIVQGAEDLVDGLGRVDPELLSLATSMAGLLGVSALLGGGFLTLFPRVMQVHAAFKTLQSTNAGLAGGLGKVGKAAGIATVALIALSTAGALFSDEKTKSASDYANAILKVANAGSKAKASDMDSVFQSFAQFGGQDTVNGINGVTDAVKALANPDWQKQVDQFFDGFAHGVLNLPKSDLGQIQDRLKGMGDAMGDMVKNGGAEAAAKSFRLLTKEFEANGKSAQDALNTMPGYKDALLEQANALGVNLEPAQLLELAQGRIPGVMAAAQAATETKAATDQAAAAATQEEIDKLTDLGVNLDGTIASLEKYTTALFNAGLIQLDARSATAAHEAALDAVKGSVEEATAALAKQYETEGESTEAARAHAEAQMGLGVALNKSRTDFELGNAAGRALNDTFQNVAKTGMAEIEAKAKAGMGQPELQKTLGTTFGQLKQTAIDMGLTGGAADALARKVMGIPPKANINTWMSDEAKRMAEATDQAVRNLDGKTAHTYVYHHEINTIENITTSSASVHNNTGGKQGAKPTFHADGGAISGPGTGTSDEVPAWLSNGEHVLTAEEVRKMGGQQAVYRFRHDLMAGDVPKFATGGHLGESANARANRLYREAQAAAKKRAKLTAEQRQKLAELQEFRRDSLLDMDRDNRRGNGYRSVTESLSSSYSFADKLTSLADSGKVGKGSIRNLYAVSGRSEAALKTLHARSDALGKSLDKAKDKLADLTQIRGEVAKSLSGEFSIGKTAQRQGLFGAGAVANTIADAKGFLAKVQGFAGKLKRLQQKGFSGAIVQEVAALGTTAGTQAADSLLQATSAQVKDLNNTMGAINAASLSAGNAVTDSLYRGGVNGAAANVKNLEWQEGAISKAMLQIGLGMENALRQALGGKPIKRAGGGAVYGPGTSTSDEVPMLASNGEHVFTADEVRRMGGQRAVYAFRAQLQHLPAPSKSLAGGYGQVQSIPASAMAWGSSAAAVQRGGDTHHWNIYDQSNPVATGHEVARRQRMLGT
ncbi:tail length tape measure protein [Arthrobacter phage TripleJ]|uniref:Tape measure protein n=1 Tax=Arthrobacter phage TripleJ TaxID=2599838 RepID=A0A5J6TLF8_9CAUD|nr:tail length tape measure protein [Arthrobacter phage TripleJ]QFG09562.1 tape measure protein [Arthrobacter phage TripleJ]